MITCTTGTHAAYLFNGITSYVPVEAWDADGNPLVAGDRGLVHADEYRALGLFAYLESAQAVRDAHGVENAPVSTPRPIARATVISAPSRAVPRQRVAA